MAFTTHDNAPYLYRRSGGGGDKEIDKLVGGTIAWNQLVQNGDFADGSTSWYGSKGSVSNGEATVTINGSWNNDIRQHLNTVANHVYFGMFKAKSASLSTQTVWFAQVNTSDDTAFARCTALTTGYKTACGIGKTTVNGTAVRLVLQENGSSLTNQTFNVDDVNLFDLTLMFGSTIADYVYSLEQSSQGSGLAWLRSYGFFTEDYYDYNSSELKSVSNLVSHDMTGFNQWDGESETGYIDLNTGNEATSSANQRSKYVRVFPSTTYCYTNETVQSGIRIAFYDANKVFVGNFQNRTNTPQVFTTPSNAFYMRFYWADISRVCINISSSRNGEYEPYTLHSYPLGDVTLRGVPKLVNNKMQFDGDIYASDGTVQRRYGIVDLGTLTWGKGQGSGGLQRMFSTALSSIAKSFDNTIKGNCVCSKYITASANDGYTGTIKECITIDASATVSVYTDTSYTDGAAFKTAMSGVYLVYELASSTTETADTYTNPQWVDPNGTERYTLSANAFPMPVGHETTYNTDIGSKTVNTQVNLSMTEPSVRQVYAKEGDTARVLNIHLDQTEEDGTLRILRPDGTEVTAEAVLVPEFYDGLMAEIPSDATSVVGKCYCDVEQNGVSSMPFTLNVKKNERES